MKVRLNETDYPKVKYGGGVGCRRCGKPQLVMATVMVWVLPACPPKGQPLDHSVCASASQPPCSTPRTGLTLRLTVPVLEVAISCTTWTMSTRLISTSRTRGTYSCTSTQLIRLWRSAGIRPTRASARCTYRLEGTNAPRGSSPAPVRTNSRCTSRATLSEIPPRWVAGNR